MLTPARIKDICWSIFIQGRYIEVNWNDDKLFKSIDSRVEEPDMFCSPYHNKLYLFNIKLKDNSLYLPFKTKYNKVILTNSPQEFNKLDKWLYQILQD